MRLVIAAAALCAAFAAFPAACYQPSGLPYCGAEPAAQADACVLQCGFCATAELNSWMPPAELASLCAAAPTPALPTLVTAAIINASAVHGYFIIEDGFYEALENLVANMPRRDMILLFSTPLDFSDFLFEHVRYALRVRPLSVGFGVPPAVFLDAVLPYSILDEKRDLAFRWRPRMWQALAPLVAAANASNLTAVMHVVADAIPALQLAGLLGTMGAAAASTVPIPGPPVTWRSETSPARLSVQDVVSFGGSCTGTGIVLVAAARSVGVPARLAGCSESVVRLDDHHWAEFYDPASTGPFGDGWHTREGTAAGNPDGPWDAPSGPMLGCMAGVVPGSPMDTLWATSWGSAVNMPTLWANDTRSATWARIGGVNRCGAYCGAWGCGVNNTVHYTQAQCGPA